MFEKLNEKWDKRFLDLAKHVTSWSKDPSTQTGAVIVDANRRVVSLGYNGLPIGVEDRDEVLNNRELKYKQIVHCERNALLFARQDLTNTCLYTYPFISCSVCAAMVIQAGIKRCVAPKLDQIQDKLRYERWEEELKISRSMFSESGVILLEYDLC